MTSQNIDQCEIHIKIKKRTGNTYLTYVENLDKIELSKGENVNEFLKKITKFFKKSFMCGAFIEENEKGSKIIVMNGDHRQKLKELLIDKKIVQENQIKIHGF
ncbi:translation initiation factor 1 [Indivirus ILV1]|uniref:Translation initiation factor 1 n=1 Tax=Indivirus ILV1 TaxID=1977633 RepID=A0A1V0SCW6_9VIRU|nr:translation initiation factor 1 [Indivirus ILV1]